MPFAADAAFAFFSRRFADVAIAFADISAIRQRYAPR